MLSAEEHTEKNGHLLESGAGRALLVVNAKARQGQENFRLAMAELEKQDIHLVDALAVRHPRDIKPLVEKALKRGNLDTVIVGGGDGTISMLAGILAHRHINMGVIPMGTANDFAKNLNLGTDIARAAAIIKEGYLLPIDLGQAGDRFFLNVASIGLGVEVANKMSPTLKKWLGPLAYAVAAGQAFKRMRPMHINLIFKDKPQGEGYETVEISALQVAIANGRFYGGGLVSAPNTTIADNKLSVTVIKAGQILELVRIIPGLRNGSYLKHPKVRRYVTTELVVETRHPRSVNLDGEICQTTPIEFKVAPKALKVFAPRP